MPSGRGQAEASRRQAAYMKEKGISRRTGRCPICNKIIPLPMDNHISNTCRR